MIRIILIVLACIATGFCFGFSREEEVGLEAVTCAEIVQKSCSDYWGDFPTPAIPLTCFGASCATLDFCTTGENLVIVNPLTVMDEVGWNKKRDTPISSDVGKWTSFDVRICSLRTICGYECIVHPVLGRRCQDLFENDLTMAKVKNQYEPCETP